MKDKFLILTIVFLAFTLHSCKDSITKKETTKVSIESVKPEDSNKLMNDLMTQIDSIQIEDLKSESSTDIEQDCIFDLATQTDEFLKGIKEFENYVWNSETKTAEIVLNDHWGLTIKRGGCDYFELSAKFIYDRVLDIEVKQDKEIIFNNIIWITSLLEEFDGEDIKKVIKDGKVTITKGDEFNYHANFMDVKLYELYYFNFNNKDITTFDIGYYYN